MWPIYGGAAMKVINVSKIQNFSRDRDYEDFSVARVYTGHLKSLGGRNNWVTIASDSRKIYRMVKGASISADTVELDYDSRLMLGITGNSREDDNYWKCKLTVSRASFIQKMKAHWDHPEISYQVSYRISLIGLVLGVMGFLQGIYSLVK